MRGRFKMGIADESNASPGYHRPIVGAMVNRRGRGGEGRTMPGDVALAYSAAARDAGRSPSFLRANVTAAELRRYYRDGWGTLDDDRHGRGLFAILLHTIAQTGSNVPAKMTAAWREFAPCLPADELGGSPTKRSGSAAAGRPTSSRSGSGSTTRIGSGSASP
jgi:hypothetical protein